MRSGRTCSVQHPGFHGARRASCTPGTTTSRPAPRCAPAQPPLRCRRTAAAGMDGNVQRRADVRLEILEERLERLQLGLRALFQRTPQPLEQLADLPLVVRLAAPEGQRRPQRLAHLLQQFLERATCLGRGIVDVPALEPLAGVPKNVRRFILRRPRARTRSSRT